MKKDWRWRFLAAGVVGLTVCGSFCSDSYGLSSAAVCSAADENGYVPFGPGAGKGEDAKEAQSGGDMERMETGGGQMANSDDGIKITRLAAAQETDSLILTIGKGGCEAAVSYYKKDSSGEWEQIFSTPGVYGRNGATGEKREGDGKTPTGVYKFTLAFGIKEDPGSALQYHELTPYDYWVDDSDSRYYNRMVDARTAKKDWKSAEHMAGLAPYYNYGLALNYNEDCVPEKGSAIFMHCTGSVANSGSAGCIQVPEEYMKKLVQTVDAGTTIVIVADQSQLEYIN